MNSDCNTPDFPYHLLQFAQVHAHWICDATQPSHPVSASFSFASIFPSIRVFSNESAIHIRWPKYRRSSFSISLSAELRGWLHLRLTGFDLLGAQGTLKSLLQHHSLNTSFLQHSALFIIGPAHTCVHDYWKEHSLDYTDLCWQNDVFAFNTLSRFVTAFLPRSNRLLISWLQSPSTVILEPNKRKSVTTSIFSPSTCHEVMGLDAMIFS